MLMIRYMLMMACLVTGIAESAAQTATGKPSKPRSPFARPERLDAQAHLDKGNKLYHLALFEQAIVEFRAGTLLEDAPVFAFNLGQAHRHLKQFSEAIWHYERFLQRGQPEGKRRDAIVGLIAEMRAVLNNKAQTMPPTEAEPVSPQSATVPARLVEATPGVPTPTTPTSTDWIGWSLTGAGIAGVAAGGYLLFDASRLRDQAQSAPSQQQRQQLNQDARSRVVAGGITAGVGAALVIAGVVKLAVPDRGGNPGAWLVPTSTGVMVVGQF